MLKFLIIILARIKAKYEECRLVRRWEELRGRGMHIGEAVFLPMSTWIDTPHCFLISIGDRCAFGPNCSILAHDGLPNPYIDATRIAKVTIHESCSFGMGTIILPGVEIGPRSITGAGSVVSKDIPPDSVAAGNPARVICTLDEFLNKHREEMKTAPIFPFEQYDYRSITQERMAEMIEKLDKTHGYITGGRTAAFAERNIPEKKGNDHLRSQSNENRNKRP
jgi:maltose O-acetyltransferase